MGYTINRKSSTEQKKPLDKDKNGTQSISKVISCKACDAPEKKPYKKMSNFLRQRSRSNDSPNNGLGNTVKGSSNSCTESSTVSSNNSERTNPSSIFPDIKTDGWLSRMLRLVRKKVRKNINKDSRASLSLSNVGIQESIALASIEKGIKSSSMPSSSTTENQSSKGVIGNTQTFSFSFKTSTATTIDYRFYMKLALLFLGMGLLLLPVQKSVTLLS